MNRRLEFALAECEWLSEMALMAGGSYDRQALSDGWETILRNQFHDIIPGSSINEVYQDCHREYGAVVRSLTGVAAGALAVLTQSETDAYTLWHFGSFARRDLAFIPETREGGFVDAQGNALRAQRAGDGYWVEVALPPMAAATVRFAAASSAPESPFTVDMEARTIATPHYQAAWDENGRIVRLFDRDNGREVIPAGERANVLEIYEDKPLNFDNWDVDIFHLFKHEDVALSRAPELTECGALRAVIRFAYAYRSATFVQDVIFYADSRRIDFATQAEWHEDHRLLKAAFPVDIRATKATYDIQFGHVERPTHFNTSWDYARFEVVAHKWADLSEEGYGVSLLNDCKYGHSVKDNVMRITLLKSCLLYTSDAADE